MKYYIRVCFNSPLDYLNSKEEGGKTIKDVKIKIAQIMAKGCYLERDDDFLYIPTHQIKMIQIELE